MEIKDVVALVLGSNFIIAVATFLTTFLTTRMQIKNSTKQFEKEFEKAIVTYYRERRREVRSEPLLKLRSELAIMATKLERLAKAGHSLAVSNTEEQVKGVLEKATNDWNNYILGDDLQRVLFIQSDEEIVKLVKEIRNDYLDAYDVVAHPEGRTAIEFGQAIRSSEEKIAPKVVKAQELINQRLETL